MLIAKRFSKSNNILWDSFVKNANNGTIFHLRRFLSYHPEDRFFDHSVEFYKKNRLFSVFPAAELNINAKKLLVSHPGSTVGSFVVLESVSISDSLELIKILIDYAKKTILKVLGLLFLLFFIKIESLIISTMPFLETGLNI